MLRNEPLARYTRFGTGGPADLFVRPESISELALILKNNVVRPITILGMGSNVIVPDDGIRGMVIQTRRLHNIEIRGATIAAECGAPMSSIANFAAENGIAGLEFMAGIPGTIGGGLITNAGCFGGEIKDVLIAARGFDFDGNAMELSAGECGLSYRASRLPPDFIISELILRADRTDNEADIRNRIREIIEKKSAGQPTDARTAGSTFRNPPDAPAWKKIKEAFPNGQRIGGARISEVHANFIVADDGCASADIIGLIGMIQEKTGLELEVKIL